MKNKRILALVTVLISTLSFNSLAGTKIVIQSLEDDQINKDSTMLIQGNKLRMSYFDNSDSTNSDIIFDHESQTMMAIDPEEKSYTVFEAVHLASVKAKMDAIKQQMETQLAKLPAEQQAMMREMMAGKMGIGEPKTKPVKKIVRTDNKGAAAGYDCQYVEVYSNEVKKRELCITPWSKLKNGNEVKIAMQGMMSFFEKVMDSVGQFSQDDDMPFSEINELGGFPIIYKEYKNGKITEQSKLKSIDDESISEELFVPPIGYKKQSLNDMM